MKKSIFASLTFSLIVIFSLSAHADYVIKKAKAVMYNQDGKKIGVVKLKQVKQGVELNINVKNLSPGPHGFHFHEVGRCDGPDFKTAGGHFNPNHKHHGMENPQGWHAGDLVNLEVEDDGKAKGTLLDYGVTLAEGDNSLFHPGGTALIIHADADDNKSDPSGNSGDRIACGVVNQD